MIFEDAIADWTAACMAERARVVEEACEKAIQDGRYGVLVETEHTWDGYQITAGPHPSVPYGQIHDRSTYPYRAFG